VHGVYFVTPKEEPFTQRAQRTQRTEGTEGTEGMMKNEE
jgi:hypothetical protein